MQKRSGTFAVLVANEPRAGSRPTAQLSATIIALATSLCASAALAQTAAQIPPEAFGRRPAVYGAAISPDGERVVLAESNPEGLTWVSVINLANPRERSTFGTPAD